MSPPSSLTLTSSKRASLSMPNNTPSALIVVHCTSLERSRIAGGWPALA